MFCLIYKVVFSHNYQLATRHEFRMAKNVDVLLHYWNEADLIDLPTPSEAGTTMSITIDRRNFEEGAKYFFAIKSYDEMNQISDLSNIASLLFGVPKNCLAYGECTKSELIALYHNETYNSCLDKCKSESRCEWVTINPEFDICFLFDACDKIDEELCPNCLSSNTECDFIRCNETGLCQVI